MACAKKEKGTVTPAAMARVSDRVTLDVAQRCTPSLPVSL